WLNMGIALVNMQNFPEARKMLAKAAERDPKNPRTWFNLGLLDKADGHADEAITDFEKAAANDPNDADCQYFIGLLTAQQQQYDRAIAAYSSALKLNSFHVSAEFGLAQALSRKGHAPSRKRTPPPLPAFPRRKTGCAHQLHLRRARQILARADDGACSRAGRPAHPRPFRKCDFDRRTAFRVASAE